MTNKLERSGQIEPGWHAWVSYKTMESPAEDPALRTKQRKWERPEPLPHYTATPGAYKSYNTYVVHSLDLCQN